MLGPKNTADRRSQGPSVWENAMTDRGQEDSRRLELQGPP